MEALVHLAAGIGNIVLATPLLIALHDLGYQVDLRLSADYEATADLLRGWSVLRDLISDTTARRYDVVLPAIPPFYWSRFQRAYQGMRNCVARPPDALFHQDEQAYYLAFARALGFPENCRPEIWLPVGPSTEFQEESETVILAPGCKTGEMALKRWPWFAQLAGLLPDVAVVGTADDLYTADGASLAFPPQVRNFVGKLSLRQTAELIAGAALVVANDTGLAYVAAAVGTPTVILFGPTPDRSLGPLPAHVTSLRHGLPCEPCWFGSRFGPCNRRIDCLRSLTVERVLAAVEHHLNGGCHGG
ncbi:MAG TPA: glycosyltransferase family 9 protein [Bryobacteraceae bacterium]|jgi:ADP-heptose:LPS heptosyltransferase